MATYVTLDAAQRHLRRPVGLSSPPTDDEIDLQAKLDQAEALILDYITVSPDDWTAAQQLIVQSAILEQLAELSRFRGDDTPLQGAAERDAGYLAPALRARLMRLREPTVA